MFDVSWGILSTSLVVCENSLIRTRSNIIGVVRFVIVQPTDKACCQFFQPCRCLKWSVDNSCKLHCASTCSRIAYLEHEGSTVWSSKYVEKAIALHIVVPRFVVIVLREIIFVVFPAFKEAQISAARFRAVMWWKLLRWIYRLWQYLYAPLCTSMHHFKWRRLEVVEEMY